MVQYIDKDALVAEIEKLKYVIMPYPTMAEKVAYRDGIEDTIKIVIKSLEVKEGYVDKEEVIEKAAEWLTKHAKKYYFNKERYLGTEELVEDFKLAMTL